MANVTFHDVTRITDVSMNNVGNTHWLSISTNKGEVTWFFEDKATMSEVCEGIAAQLTVEVEHEK